jgi:hypothetical protein
MKFSYRARICAILLAIFSMLFMQMALASYACPSLPSGAGSALAAATAMPGCDSMDMEQPALCHAHSQDQANKQSLDKPASPQVHAFVASTLVQTVLPLDFSLLQHQPSVANALSVSSLAPDIAILHCCFRI